MSSDVAVRVSGLSKCYLIYQKPLHRLLQMLWRGRRRFYKEFWAVRDVSFEIRRGQTTGIIGRNGAGKSTLLQLICGTLDPTEGQIVVNGKVAALLELGAGFNPEFTGVENVYLSASLYGLTRKQIDDRYEDIATFADIGEFIDRPVKTYSSGMFVRLAFAVIAHVDADILVVDEALSVGDAYFQQKCMRYLDRFKAQGGTLLFVSHDMGTVNAICSSALLLRRTKGRYLCDTGTAKDIAALYLRDLHADKAAEIAVSRPAPSGDTEDLSIGTIQSANPLSARGSVTLFHATSYRSDADSFGVGGGVISDVSIRGLDGQALTELFSGHPVDLVVRARALHAMSYPAIGFMLKDRRGQYVIAESTDSYLRDHAISVEAGREFEVVFRLTLPPLVRGEYTFDVAFAEGPGEQHVQHQWVHDVIGLTAINSQLVHGISGASELTVEFRVI